MVVSLAGGFMDAYSFLLHGEVFANGQTGNYVLLVLHAVVGDWMGTARYAVPIVAFICGIVFSKHVSAKVHGDERLGMQHWVAIFEAAAFAVLAAVSELLPDLAVNSTISFLAAMSFETFRKFGTKSAYADVFVTGNLRSFGEALYEGFVRGNAHERHRALRYAGILASFGTGVFMGQRLIGLFSHWSCIAISLLFLLANLFVADTGLSDRR